MLKNFWTIDNEADALVFPNQASFEAHLEHSTDLNNAILAEGIELVSTKAFRGRRFKNVSFKKCNFRKTTFLNSHFEECIFNLATFNECVFENCTFTNCNVWKAEFTRVTIDPDSFRFDREYRSTHANVGLGLFRRLHRNAEAMSDPEFTAAADAHRRRWLRAQTVWEWKQGRIFDGRFVKRYVLNLAFDLIARYGYGVWRFVLVSIAFWLGWSLLLHVGWDWFGLVRNDKALVRGDFSLSVFYTFNIATTLGFTDVIPASVQGRLYSVVTALLGVAWGGLFIAILVRRVLR